MFLLAWRKRNMERLTVDLLRRLQRTDSQQVVPERRVLGVFHIQYWDTAAVTTSREEFASPTITWGYRRKSSLQQSYERQTKALHDVGIPEERIFEDIMSGKTMNRPGWLDLLSRVRR